jgi:hypothetical protein
MAPLLWANLGSHFSLVIHVTVGKLPFTPKNIHFHDFYGILWHLGADLSVFTCEKMLQRGSFTPLKRTLTPNLDMGGGGHPLQHAVNFHVIERSETYICL